MATVPICLPSSEEGDDDLGATLEGLLKQRRGSIRLEDDESAMLEKLPSELRTKVRGVFTMGLTGDTYYDYDHIFNRKDSIEIVHFNDVYNLDPGADGVGGMARFVTALRRIKHVNPLILFSGDLFNPSMLSTVMKGRQMVPFVNQLRIHSACVGNHDLDFGMDVFEKLSGSCNFPWLLTNLGLADGRRIPGTIETRVFEWQGWTVGIMGLAEWDWVLTCPTILPSDVSYEDFVQSGRNTGRALKDRGCDFVIALTHMRAANDFRLAKETDGEIDLILGGHDHYYSGFHKVGNCLVGKSGTDFREFTRITIYPPGVEEPPSKPATPFSRDADQVKDLDPEDDTMNRKQHVRVDMPTLLGGSTIRWSWVEVSPSRYRQNVHVNKMIKKYSNELAKKLEEVIGGWSTPNDTRFNQIRRYESDFGNFICELMRRTTGADIAILNSGTIRADCLYKPGSYTLMDLVTQLPMQDELNVVEIDGTKLLEVLNAGVSKWPALEGRFLQVGGVRFEFESNSDGCRVIPESVITTPSHLETTWKPLKYDQLYKLVVKNYLLSGRDGFECLIGAKVLVDGESVPTLPLMARNFFGHIVTLNQKNKPGTANAQILKRKLERLTETEKGRNVILYDYNLHHDGEKFLAASFVDGRIKSPSYAP